MLSHLFHHIDQEITFDLCLMVLGSSSDHLNVHQSHVVFLGARHFPFGAISRHRRLYKELSVGEAIYVI